MNVYQLVDGAKNSLRKGKLRLRVVVGVNVSMTVRAGPRAEDIIVLHGHAGEPDQAEVGEHGGLTIEIADAGKADLTLLTACEKP